jgi:trk system potassium uptake protein
VNHPKNEWMFNESWGVDVAVSTPRIMAALVEEAVSVGDLVRLFTFRQGEANLVELTLPEDSTTIGRRVQDVSWPPDTTLVTIVRAGRVLVPTGDTPLEGHDELLFVAVPEREKELQELLSPHQGQAPADGT